MECSGRISAVGEGVEGHQVGDEVCALLAAGGYAEKVAVPAGQVMPVPAGVDVVTAAALPEVACTVWSNVFMIAGLQQDETLLVHGGAGGIGTMAIQLAKALGARVFATAGSPEKLKLCESLGADRAISYRDEDFVEVLSGGRWRRRDPGQHGRQVPRTQRHRAGDRGPAGGHRHAGRHQGRARPGCAAAQARCGDRNHAAGPARREEKSAICASVVEHVWPLVAEGKVRAVVHEQVPLEEAGRAHELMESGSHSGKIVLTTGR